MVENKTIGSKIFDVVNLILLLAITVLCIVPLWYILMISVSEKEAVNAGLVSFWPIGFNLLSYEKIMGETQFFVSFWTSIKRVVLGGLIGVGSILMTAYPLSKTKTQFPARNVFMWILVFCMLFNGGTVPWYLTMKSYGMVDNIWGLVLAGSLPVFNVILVVNFFRNLPPALEEAAYVDGAGPWRTFISLFIPLSKPVIATVSLWIAVNLWNDWTTTLYYVTNEKLFTLQYKLMQLIKESERLQSLLRESAVTGRGAEVAAAAQATPESLVSAQVVITTIPIIAVYPFVQKYFVQGITLGAVKQ